MIGKILLHIRKNLSEARHYKTSVVSKQVWFVPKTTGGFMVVAAVHPQENCAIFTVI